MEEFPRTLLQLSIETRILKKIIDNCKLNIVSKGNDFHGSPHMKQSFMGRWVGHTENAFSKVISCCTLPFPRVTCEIFSFSVMSLVIIMQISAL